VLLVIAISNKNGIPPVEFRRVVSSALAEAGSSEFMRRMNRKTPKV